MTTSGERPDWNLIYAEPHRGELQTKLLPAYFAGQRWFGAKSTAIERVDLVEVGTPTGIESTRLFIANVMSVGGKVESYFFPIALRAAGSPDASANRVVGVLDGVEVVDALFDPDLGRFFYALIEDEGSMAVEGGAFRAIRTSRFPDAPASGWADADIRAGTFEQSNSTILYGDKLLLKIFRKLDDGLNPDFEIGQFLGDQTSFRAIPLTSGCLLYQPEGREVITVGILQNLVANQGPAWEQALGQARAFYEKALGDSSSVEADRPPLDWSDLAISPADRQLVGHYLDAAALLGRRTGELHLALGSSADFASFRPEKATRADIDEVIHEIGDQYRRASNLVENKLDALDPPTRKLAEAFVGLRDGLADRLKGLSELTPGVDKIRIHGDYHLGQVLVSGDDFVLLDFEGEPAKPLARRVEKQLALRDVVGMIRSFDYAAFSALFALDKEKPGSFEAAETLATLWRDAATRAFLSSYLEVTHGRSFLPTESAELFQLLDALLLNKALYELLYELNNRPTWVRIPLQGLIPLLDRR